MNTSEQTANRIYDAIIVGSGAGGAAAAYRLSRAGLDVLLLEKGKELPKDGSTLDIGRVVSNGEFLSSEPWRDPAGGSFRPEEHFNLGGKTKWYGAALIRYAPHEFEADASFGCRAWPIVYDELEPYYTEAERLLGVRYFDCEPGLNRILSKLTRTGGWRTEPLPLGLSPDILDDVQETTHFDGFASVRDLKSDAQTALLSRVSAMRGLSVMTDTAVTELLEARGDSRRVAGVRTRDGREFHGRATLLAAGALHSPRLLQQYLEHNDLVERLPAARHVGRNLKLHLLTAMVSVGTRRQHDALRKTMLILNRRYPHSSIQPLGFDAELMARLIPGVIPRLAARQIAERSYGFFLQTEDGAHPDNRVRRATPGDPRSTMDYSPGRVIASEREHRQLTRAFKRALVKAGFLSFTQRIGLNGTAHAQGTLVAGESSRDSVVDADGRVHGLESLYVVDGSALPRSGRANPALTIYAWALRVADHLTPTLARREQIAEVLV